MKLEEVEGVAEREVEREVEAEVELKAGTTVEEALDEASEVEREDSEAVAVVLTVTDVVVCFPQGFQMLNADWCSGGCAVDAAEEEFVVFTGADASSSSRAEMRGATLAEAEAASAEMPKTSGECIF